MRNHDLNTARTQMETRLMLDTMQADSQRWPSLVNMNERVDDNVILPQTIINHEEYAKKMQNLAFYAEQGDHQSMQKLLDKEEIMEKKNLLLQPLFRDIKSLIRHMSNTEEYKILKEFVSNRTIILANYVSKIHCIVVV